MRIVCIGKASIFIFTQNGILTKLGRHNIICETNFTINKSYNKWVVNINKNVRKTNYLNFFLMSIFVLINTSGDDFKQV